MVRIIPPKADVKTTFGKNLTIIDLIILLMFGLVGTVFLSLKLNFLVRIILASVTIGFGIAMVIEVGGGVKIYQFLFLIFKYLLRNREIKSFSFKDIGLVFLNGAVKHEDHFIGIIEVKGIDFGILNESRQDQIIMVLKEVFTKVKNGKIVKVDVPLDFSKQIKNEEKRLAYAESLAKQKIVENELDQIKYWHEQKTILTPNFYLLITENTLEELNDTINFIKPFFLEASFSLEVLKDDKLKNFFVVFFNEETLDDDFLFPEVHERSSKITFEKESYQLAAISKLQLFAGNGWLSSLFLIPETKVVLNFSQRSDKLKTINKLNRAIVELNNRYLSNSLTESMKTELDYKISGLKNLIDELTIGSEDLFDCELLILYPLEYRRQVYETFKLSSIYVNKLFFQQLTSYMDFLPWNFKYRCKAAVKNLTTSTLASTFPFISRLFFDLDGHYLGYSDSVVFFDLFNSWHHRLSKRTNANMVILGKPGSGKSYFSKKLLLEQALDGCKVFVLDPENEYDKLARSLEGSLVDVGGIRSGVINPLQIFSSLADGETKTYEELTQHRQFLEAFFKTTIPELNQELLSILNDSLKELYKNFNITEMTDISKLRAEEFPIFENLACVIDEKFKVTSRENKNQYEIEAYRKLKIYLSDFRSGGIHAKLWNGTTTFQATNKFVVLNFQSLFANSNKLVANGQMLVLMRYLMQEIIKNKEQNDSQNEKSNIVIMIDEAHQFINPEFPVALSFMSQMVKRIRKYGGSMIIATQNIKDFIGYSDSTKTQATAVINGCQYSMLFGLNPDDVNSVVDLYKGYNGGLTDTEKEQLANANRGEALLIVDANTRLIFKVDLFNDQEGLFQ